MSSSLAGKTGTLRLENDLRVRFRIDSVQDAPRCFKLTAKVSRGSNGDVAELTFLIEPAPTTNLSQVFSTITPNEHKMIADVIRRAVESPQL